MDYSWYILLVRGGKEKETISKIWEELAKTDFPKKIADLRYVPKSTKGKNLLSRYIFCYCSLDEKLVQLIYSMGVYFPNYTKSEKDLPAPLSPKAAAEFLKLSQKAEKGEIEKNENSESFQIGDWVKVKQEGVYESCEGEITDINQKKGLIIINTNFLGYSTPIEVPTKEGIKNILVKIPNKKKN